MHADAEIEVLFEDPHFIAVNKPAGLLVHPTDIDAHNHKTLIGILSEQTDKRCAPVHRLDRATSGVMLLALTADAARAASALWPDKIVKRYHAVARGYMSESIDLEHTVRDRDSGVRQLARTRFRPLAQTEIDEAVDRYPTARYSLVEAEPLTGRRHQIRQHLKHLSHPIIGDTSYGKSVHNRFFAARFDAPRLLLMAKELRFKHPFTGLPIHLEATPDAAFQRVLDALPWKPILSTKHD